MGLYYVRKWAWGTFSVMLTCFANGELSTSKYGQNTNSTAPQTPNRSVVSFWGKQQTHHQSN